MTPRFNNLLLVPLFASCTAISQQSEYLDALPRPNVPIFEENFERGLGKWNQTAGSWSTVSTGVSLALQSPASAAAITFTISTVSNIDLTGKTGCHLKYDVYFDLSGAAGVLAQILYAGNVIAEFKNTAGTAAISSSGLYVTRKSLLPGGVSGKNSIITAVATSTTADLRIDNMSVTCGNTLTGSVSVLNEDFNAGSSANWAINGTWAYTSGIGFGGTMALGANSTGPEYSVTYLPTIDLRGKSACELKYYYDMTGTTGGSQYCFIIYWNTMSIRRHCGPTTNMIVHKLTAFEETDSNQLRFGCARVAAGGGITICNLDNVSVTCEQ